MAKITKEKFFNIDPLTLVAGRPLTFDLYIYLPLNERIIIFKSSGMVIDDLEKLNKMKEHGLSDLHVRETDRAAFDAYLTDTAIAVKRELSAEKTEEQIKIETEKLSVQTAAMLDAKAAPVPPPAKEFVPEKPPEEIMIGLLRAAPENLESRNDAKNMVKDILRASGASSGVSEIVDNPNTEHATSVAIYTTLFAIGLKKTDQNLLQDLIIASLLHDIGFTQLNPAVLNTPRLKHTGVQKAAYESHVTLGMNLLADLDYVPNKRVIMLLSQHHEKFNGTGYPQNLESFRVDEYAQLISIADLVDTISHGKYDGTVRPLSGALQMLAQIEHTSSFPEFFNPDTFKKVMTWLKKGGGEDYMATAEKAVIETKQALLKTG